MKNRAFLILFSIIRCNENTYYQLEVHKELVNGYFSSKSFNVSAVHVEGIKSIMQNNAYVQNHSYFVHLTRRSANIDDICIVCNAELTQATLHKLAQYIPVLLVEYN